MGNVVVDVYDRSIYDRFRTYKALGIFTKNQRKKQKINADLLSGLSGKDHC